MRLRFNIGQLLLLTALVGLLIALLTTVYGRARGMFAPDAVSYSPDGEAVAVRFSDGTVRVWSRAGKLLGSFDTREGWISLSQPGRMRLLSRDRLMTVTGARQFELWDVKTGRSSGAVGRPSLNPLGESSAVSGDGSTAAEVRLAAQSRLGIWDLEAGRRVKQMQTDSGMPVGLSLSHDGNRLATVNQQGQVAIWDVETEQRLAGPYALNVEPYFASFAFSSDLRVVAAADEASFDPNTGQAIQLLDTRTGQRATVYAPEPVVGLELSPDGLLLAGVGTDGAVTFLDTRNGEQRGRIAVSQAQIDSGLLPAQWLAVPVDFSPGGDEVIIGARDEVGIYEAPGGKLAKRLWTSRQHLSGWFFGPALFAWALLWGWARREQRPAEASADANTGDADDASAPNGEAPPEEAGEPARDESPQEADEVATAAPPTLLKVAWILLLLGGIVAISWGTAIIFAEGAFFALTPFPYYSLYVGIAATAAASARRTQRMTVVHILQIGNILCCDLTNVVLGIVGLVLVRRPAVASYLKQSKA